MNKLRINITVLALALAIAALSQPANAQDTTGQDQGGAPPAATGPDTDTQTIESPPLSGLDQPSFEPGFGARSYLLPTLEVNEAVDTNQSGQLTTGGGRTVNASAITGVTRALGSLTLQKLWKLHPLDLDYSGGLAWYQGLDTVYQVHSFSGVQRFLWRTGQLALRDSFSYLPTGTFGFNSYGGSGALTSGLGGGVTGGGLGSGTGLNTLGNTSFGSTVNQPRISNMSIVDVTQALSPRNSVTLAGGYGISDFLSNPTGYVNSHEYLGQAGFSRRLTRQDQVAVEYAYQNFNFPTQGNGFFYTNTVQGLYDHHINGKLDLQIGGGPQWIHEFFVQSIKIPGLGTAIFPVSSNTLSGSGRVTLNYYRSARTNLSLFYTHSADAGSGLLTGANTDAIRLTLSHQLTRRWSMTTDTGYSYSKRILSATTQQAGNSSAYRYWYAGASLHRQLTRQVGAFADYQYDAIGFAKGICSTTPGACATGYGHHVGLIGLNWTPSPIRLE